MRGATNGRGLCLALWIWRRASGASIRCGIDPGSRQWGAEGPVEGFFEALHGLWASWDRTGEAVAGDAAAGVLRGALGAAIDGADGVRSSVSLTCGAGVDDPVWDHSTSSKNWDRLLEGGDRREVPERNPGPNPRVKQLLSSEHFSVDGTLIEAWASLKSFRKKDGGDNDHEGTGRNAERSFHKEKRSNETHESTTDPEAKLYKKGDGQPAKLCYRGPAGMENRHGLAVLGG